MGDEEQQYEQYDDMLLEAFMELVERPDSEIGLTLWVPGGVVSGTLVGRTEWLARMATRYPQASDVVNGAAAGLAGAPEVAERILHLADARMVTGSYVGAQIFWRGRLDMVAAWALGIVAPA